MTIEEEIQALFIEREWTLSLAESCTGGRVASKLTVIPGASNYFLGSVVSYSNAAKMKFLGVSEALIDQKGAVSQEVVIAMAEGALTAFESDFSLAVSGIAGPGGGSQEKPVGTIWAAIAKKGIKTHSWQLLAHGNREIIIESTANDLLAHLLHLCASKKYVKSKD